jgi:uncharacterized protein (DUF302 family)
MKRLLLSLALCLPLAAAAADGANGFVSKPSKYSVAETLDRIEALVKSKGIVVFARIDHSGDAEKAGLKLLPTQLLIIGHPKAGTPVMNAARSAAIDLPLKVLAWEDGQGKVWASFNSPAYLQQRHGFADDLVKNVSPVAGLIDQALQ